MKTCGKKQRDTHIMVQPNLKVPIVPPAPRGQRQRSCCARSADSAHRPHRETPRPRAGRSRRSSPRVTPLWALAECCIAEVGIGLRVGLELRPPTALQSAAPPFSLFTPTTAFLLSSLWAPAPDAMPAEVLVRKTSLGAPPPPWGACLGRARGARQEMQWRRRMQPGSAAPAAWAPCA